MNIDIRPIRWFTNAHDFFFAFEVYQNKTGFEKGKATLSKSGYIYVGDVETVWIADEADGADYADELRLQ